MLLERLPAKNEPVDRLLISFSGGETSALMAKLAKERLGRRYREVVVVFANTGEENEETLVFADRCDRAFGLDLVWVEAVTDPRMGHGTRARVVDFGTASRRGEPFEGVIAKYGIPGPGRPHCTRELKSAPIRAYAHSIGWPTGTYDTAVGIRIDEIDRMSVKARMERIVYPLVTDFPRRKVDVNEFWAAQPFRLELRGFEGNCKWCWKKSLRKHLTLMSEDPTKYDFPERMERQYPTAGSNPLDKPRQFFRGNLTVADIREMSSTVPFVPYEDDARVYDVQTDLVRMLDLDISGGCSESCEIDMSALDEETRPEPVEA